MVQGEKMSTYEERTKNQTNVENVLTIAENGYRVYRSSLYYFCTSSVSLTLYIYI